MAVIAKLNNLRTAPRKVRLVADLIRRKDVNKALEDLAFVKNKTAQPMIKLLKSAIANAKNNFQLDADKLYIATIFVNEGNKLKRFHPVSRGRANEILKRTSHITLILDEKDKKTVAKKEEKVQDKKAVRKPAGEKKTAVKKTKK